MPPKSSSIPDAWDDDYEAVIAKPPPLSNPEKISRSARRAAHEQANKKLWDSAERPEESFRYIPGPEPVVHADLKPALKVLSRKPPDKNGNGIAAGLAGVSLEDDSEEEERKAGAAAAAERARKAQEEREEKTRRYAEVRERLFGSEGTAETSAVTTKPAARGRGGRGGRGSRSPQGSTRNSRPGSTDHSPARPAGAARQLFDPNAPAQRALSFIAKREENDDKPVRAPRGPDGSGGFAGRGGATAG